MRGIKVVTVLITVLFLTGLVNAQGLGLSVRPQQFLTGLSSPILVRNAGDGTKRLFVVQQRGIIKVVQPGSNVTSDFMNIASKVSPSGDEQGLLGLAFHPDFENNRFFFVNYTRNTDGATVIARYKANVGNATGDPNSEAIILTIAQPFSNHNGGMIEFGPDGHLYIGMGDGGSANDPGNRSQNINLLLGKMLRITPSLAEPLPGTPYTVPADNPYVGIAGADEIYAIGLRNPWRFSFDRGGTNQLWAGDVGQGSIEEFQTIIKGGNYGWRVYEGTNCTNLDPSLCTPANYIMPVSQYNHSGGRCSITGGYVYRGTQNSMPNGAYTYADYCSGEVWMWNSNTSTLLRDTTRLVTSMGEDEDGELYLVGRGGTNAGTVEKLVRAKSSADFDGDFQSDISIFRPSTGGWYILNSGSGTYRITSWGLSGDIPVTDDYDGDNITDLAVFRPSSNTWYILNSNNNAMTAFNWGSNGDVPAVGDFDGDAKADYSVYREGTWYIMRSSTNVPLITQFGLPEDKPAIGDYDGDGKADISVFRPSTGVWYSLNSSNNNFRATPWGLGTDLPTQGDFDGDGRTDLAIFRPSQGRWYVLNSTTGGMSTRDFGLDGDVPVVGDYDGDGREDYAVWRPSTGIWYIVRSSNGAIQFQELGSPGDIPAPAYDAPY